MGVHTLSPQEIYQKSPRGRYHTHKRRAAVRGIGFELTFEEWWSLWEDYWDKRGRGNDEYMMCRKGDKGPYALGNVYISTGLHNRITAPSLSGPQSPTYKNVDSEAILDLVKNGIGYREIAPKFNVSTRVVARVVKEARARGELPPNTHKPPIRIPEETKTAIRLERETLGTSWGKLAAKYDIDKKSVGRILNCTH